MTGALQRLREIERWIAWIRVFAVPFALFQVSFGGTYPSGYHLDAWLATAGFGVGAAALFLLARRPLELAGARRLAVAALAFDAAVIAAYVLIYSFESGNPIRQLLYLPLVEAAVRYGIAGPLVLVPLTVPVLVVYEWLRPAPRFRVDYVTLQIGAEIIFGLIVGWLVRRLRLETATAETETAEAQTLRDELGRRVDVLDAANRCARALGSSLELEQAFAAFIRELQGLVPFARTAIVLVEDEVAQVIATAGAGADVIFAPGTGRPLRGSLLEQVLEGQTIVRGDMSEPLYPEEEQFVALGLRSRLAAPLLLGARTIGMISLVREHPDAFSPAEEELASLLGRLVATAVQNIRAYESERQTVEELRRLSALRADFVSLVSHELRSPMAAVIGSARTLQQRWRQLAPEQRDAFLALIADETGRLANLIGDVLDTSRIEAGTFSYRFGDVDLSELLKEAVAAAEIAQDEVAVRTRLNGSPPRVRGDRERLRQVVTNLIDNAIKYSPAGGEVEVAVSVGNGRARVDVRDRGPGIPPEQQRLIFEKFGRADVGPARPGTGLGLFIARSIAEAHGGTLDVRSAPGSGATFTLTLPVDGG